MRLNWWDRIATLGDPAAQLTRLGQRVMLEHAERALNESYDIAGNGPRLESWNPSSGGPNVQVSASVRRTASRRHRDLLRNNPWAIRARQAIVTHTVGHGITVEFKAEGRQTADRTERAAKVNALWTGWFGTSACDFVAEMDGYMQQAALLGGVVTEGDTFVRARWQRGLSGPVPLKLQILPASMVDSHKNEDFGDGRKIVQGIEYDKNGVRTQYWVFEQNPDDVGVSRTQWESRPVPARDMLQVYRQDEIGQARGMPWGAAVATELMDLRQFSDAYGMRQKVANLFAGFIHDTDAPSFNPATPSTRTTLPTTMEPGAMLTLPAGKKVTFNSPPLAGDYDPYVTSKLYAVAAGYGISMPMLTGRYEKYNFTSGRMGYIDVYKNIENWRWLMLVPQYLERVIEWFKEAVELARGISTSDIIAEITPPRREFMDPTREIGPEIAAQRAGLWSPQESHRSRGVSTARVLDEIAEFNKMADDRNLVLDNDPRKVTSMGLVQPKDDPEPAPGGDS